MFFHWQNLNEKRDGTTGLGIRHGRCWWHFNNKNRHDKVIQFCWSLWTHFCGVTVDWDDEDLTLMLAFPPVAFWLSFSSNWGILKRLLPRRVLSSSHPDTIVVDERKVGVGIHDGRLRIDPWTKKNEWATADPWWVRGLSFSLNPFEWHHVRHEVRCVCGEWVPADDEALSDSDRADDRELMEYPYRYTLKNGTVQERTATVYVERRAWRPRCLRWTGIIEKVRTCIDVTFSDEVGERTGSWKGGTVGCSYNLRPGETALGCLRRMERERVFS